MIRTWVPAVLAIGCCKLSRGPVQAPATRRCNELRRKGPILADSQEPYQPERPGQAPPPPQAPPRPPAPPQASQQVPQQQQVKGDRGYRSLTDQQRPRRVRRRLPLVSAAVGGVLLLVTLGIVIVVTIMGSATNQAKGLADGFTELVITGEGSRAYDDYLDPALQDQLSKEAFMSGVASLGMDGTCRPSYHDLQVSSDAGVKAADIAGVISCEGKEVDLVYRFEGSDELKMTNIKLRPKA